jgi:hypothetical protein
MENLAYLNSEFRSANTDFHPIVNAVEDLFIQQANNLLDDWIKD